MALSFSAQAFIDKIQKIATQAAGHYAAWYAQQVKRIFYDVIATWYKGYPPKFYDRHESLYRALNVWSTPDGYGFAELSSENITPTRSGDRDYIYNLTIREGWHGGARVVWANGADVYEPITTLLPRYRTPYKRYTYWGGVAAHDTPPLEAMREQMRDELSQSVVDAKWQTIFNQHMSKSF